MRLNRKIIENATALGILQLSNYVFPFLTVPYLSRILSVEHYGLILFSLSFTTYFSILCDYGFGLSATKEVAVKGHDPEQLNQIVSNVILIKFALLLVSIVINLIIVFSFAKFRDYWFIYVINLLSLVNNVFFPTWFFQGMEKMRIITTIQLIMRLISVAAIFLLIHQDTQYYLWPLINAATAIASAIYAQYILIKYFKIKYVLPNFAQLKHQLSEGWHIFISTVAISLYTVSNSFFLGMLTSTAMVAYYASAEKILTAVQGLLGPISQAIFPHLTKAINQDKGHGIKLLQKALFYIGGFGLAVSIGLYLGAPLIVKIMFGHKYQLATTQVLQILAALPFVICLSNILGIQTMLPFGLTKPFSRILILSSICNVALILILVPRYSYIGSAISVLITECFVTTMMVLYLQRNGIYVWRGKLRKAMYEN